jgi:hypothetical protein
LRYCQSHAGKPCVLFALAIVGVHTYAWPVKLLQGQIWSQGDQYFQVVHLERLEVEYKTFKNLATRKGQHLHVSKKEFCRLLKHAILLTPAEIEKARIQ